MHTKCFWGLWIPPGPGQGRGTEFVHLLAFRGLCDCFTMSAGSQSLHGLLYLEIELTR